MNDHPVRELRRDPALVREGAIEAEVAIGNATRPVDLRRNLTRAGLVAA